MKTKIQRWGNSLALRIPKAFAQETQVQEGTAVVLSLSDGSLVMRRVRPSKASLRKLLSEVEPPNLNLAAFDDPARGNEAW